MSETGLGSSAKEECAICGEYEARHSVQTQQFVYRDGAQEILLTAEVPVVTCEGCGEVYLDLDAEEAQHAAVCRYLGRLTPTEIRDLRARHGFSQAKLAEVTGIGIASIKRWEAGTVIQNASLDARLRQVDEAENFKAPVKVVGRFRTQITGEMYEAARSFRLRPPMQKAA